MEGVVSVQIEGNNNEFITLRRLGVGEFFGEMSFITGKHRTASVIAATETILYKIVKGDFEKLISDNPGVSTIIEDAVRERTKSLDEKKEEIDQTIQSEKNEISTRIYMKILNKISNGILLIVIGIVHTQLVLSPDGCGNQFSEFAKTYFYKISDGMNELPAISGKTDFESFAAFWFFYFGILIIPLGFLVHSIEKEKRKLPLSFTISYLIVVVIGSYIIPNSGMALIMLPHAIYMLLIEPIRRMIKKIVKIFEKHSYKLKIRFSVSTIDHESISMSESKCVRFLYGSI